MKSVQYTSGFAFPPMTRFVKGLIIFILTAFVFELVLTNFFGLPIFGILALNASEPGLHTLWQIFTYVLVDDPSGVISMLVGLLFIWLIISPFELAFGTERTVQLCALAVLSASLPAVLVGLLMSWLTPGPAVLFGSLPIAYAGIAAMAVAARGRRLSLFGLWSMTSRQLLLLMAGLSLLTFLATKNIAILVGSLGSLGGGSWFALWITRPRTRTGFKRAIPWLKLIRGGRSEPQRPPRWIN